MAEIELVGDDDGVVVVGDRSAIGRFLDHAGLVTWAREFDLGKLRTVTKTGAAVLGAASGVVEQSAMYLKLTPESAKRLQDAGGLMKTRTKGISHAMLGETGRTSLKWLQVEDGPASMLANPAVFSGVGGLMSQFAQQAEAQELRALLVSIDEKLDDVRRTQRDAVLARMKRAGEAIEEARTLGENGGDPRTLWEKVSGEASTILDVQEDALLALRALADKIDGQRKTGELKKVTRKVEREVTVQLAILARCFELQDEFRVVELDHVLSTAPENFEGHRRGLVAAREKRRAGVLEHTTRLMARMDAAGGIANENIILHARAARSVVASLNSLAEIVDGFHAPLGIESDRYVLSATPWQVAFLDPQQRRTAAKEAGRRALVGVGVIGAIALPAVATLSKNASKPRV